MEQIIHTTPLFQEPITHVFSQITLSLIDFIYSLNLFILLPVFLTVTALLIGYFRHYQLPANALRKSLAKTLYQIRSARFIQKRSPDHLRKELDSIFTQSSFKSLWMEYCSSLHIVPAQKEETGTILATTPAELFFSKESIINARINTDFYRHLPGILVGISIISAFSGLMWGLHEFKSTLLLLQEITSASIGFVFAFFASIFITYKEKSILSRCCRLLEMLNNEIDSLYARGIKENYLARLIKMSENHPPATLEDMSKLINEIADRQSALHERQNYVLSRQIAAAIKDSLSNSTEEMVNAAKEITRSQEILAKIAGGIAQSEILDENILLRRKAG